MASPQSPPHRCLAPVLSVALVVTMAVSGCHRSSAAGSPSAPATNANAGSGAAALATTATSPAPSTSVAPPSTTSTTGPGPLRPGSTGPAVVQLQQSLSALGYWLGSADGQFGTTTQQAVFALQKAAGVNRSGVVDGATASALAGGTKPTPKSTSGHAIEVDLARQLLLIVTNGHLDGVLNTSTGGGYVYYDQGVRYVATTPTGHFSTYREIDALHMSSLGLLLRPKFFTGGFAIHGDTYVPARPVSHGCVRVSNQAIDWIWASGSDPLGTPVWVY